MQISNRFSVGVHILLSIAAFSGTNKMTSEVLAGSVGVNPVVIRRILGSLKKAGLVDVTAGTGGANLSRDPEDITLFDVYRAVEPVGDCRLFSMHNRPNLSCPVGRSIHTLLESHVVEAQKALERSLSDVKLTDLLRKMLEDPFCS